MSAAPMDDLPETLKSVRSRPLGPADGPVYSVFEVL